MTRFNTRMKGLASITALAMAFCCSSFLLQPPSLVAAPVAYSGKLTLNGFAHDGPAHFTFQLIDHNGTVLWQNAPDGAAVTVQVNRLGVLRHTVAPELNL